jgi:uncharacterized protein
MLLDLSRIRGGVEHVERRLEPSSLTAKDEAFRMTSPVALVVDVHKDGRKVRLTGRVTSTLECECSRCLEPFSVPVDVELDLMFLPASELATGAQAQADEEDEGPGVEEDDLGVSFYKDDVIDLGEVVREQFYLALPMKPLCREACQGLCPVCGVNRNRETCTCQTAWVDPRLDALKALRRR